MENKVSIIKKLEDYIIDGIVNIGDASFGAGYLTHENVVSYFNDVRGFIVIYKEGEHIIGFCFSGIWSRKKLFEYTKEHHSEAIVNSINTINDLSLGVIKTIAILPEYQKKGIGSALFERSERKLNEMKVDSLVIPAWQYEGITPMSKIINKFKYEKWFYIENFWLDICYSKKINCPKKKNSNCVCDLYFYKKTI